MGMRQKGSMDMGKHKDRQSAKMKWAPFFFPLLVDPACPPASPSSPAALRCKARPADWPGSCRAPSHHGSLHLEPRRIVSAHIIWWRTEIEMDFYGEEWMEEVFELRLSVIYDFQQIGCRLELLSRLGRANGRNCGCTLSCVPAEASPCQTFQHNRRTDDEPIMDRYL